MSIWVGFEFGTVILQAPKILGNLLLFWRVVET
jgi:hypothetical protein